MKIGESDPMDNAHLTHIMPGELMLNVPMPEGKVQIGATDISIKQQLRVSKDDDGIEVSLADGRPLQVEVIDQYRPVGGGEPYMTRGDVFVRPVSTVSFVPVEGMDFGWRAQAEGMRITDMGLMRKFAYKIGFYAVMHQEREMSDETFNQLMSGGVEQAGTSRVYRKPAA